MILLDCGVWYNVVVLIGILLPPCIIFDGTGIAVEPAWLLLFGNPPFIIKFSI